MKIKNIFSTLIILILLAVFLIGCSLKSFSSTPTPSPEVPVTSQDKGGARMTLLYIDNGIPASHQGFYLAEMLKAEGQLENMFVPALDTKTAPKDESSDNGEVIFSMVPPGKYALTLYTPLGPILIKDNNADEIIIDIVADKVIDMGTITISLKSTEFPP